MAGPTLKKIVEHSKTSKAETNDTTDYFFPPLPNYARLSDKLLAQAETAGVWLKEYKKFASKASPMTAPEYHEILGLTLTATAIARRVSLKVSTDKFYPNLYSLIVGSSGDSKSGGIKLARKMGRMAGLTPFELPAYMSPQGLLQELIGRNLENTTSLNDEELAYLKTKRKFSAQRVLLLDESSALFEWFGQDNMQGIKSLVLRLYDNPDREDESTVGRGAGVARNCYFNICGVSTKAELDPFFKKKSYWANGIWARFIFVTPSWKQPPYIFFPPAMEIPNDIPGALKTLAFTRLPQPDDNKPAKEITVSLGNGVFELWQAYDKATRHDFVIDDNLSHRYKSNYKRLPAMLIKTAILLSTLDWIESKRAAPVLEKNHFAHAYLLTEQWRESLHRMLEVPNKDGQEDSLETKALRHIPAFGSNFVITPRELSQKLNLSGVDERQILDRLIQQMEKDKLIVWRTVKHIGKDGKEYSRTGLVRSQA
ncbi:MAG: hypothetical protein RBT70_09915 [Alphaproteobacteria bacterium]|jgi:hypothetical protein|nr:hypothetical protein [Alphaproteobacteria bacterium]